MPKSRSKPERLTHEEFVVVWQAAESLADAAAKARVTPREASVRAFGLRKAGVNLKRFKKYSSPVDVDRLNALVAGKKRKR